MFLIFALPRSRTAWLANALSHGGSVCHHDLSVEGVEAVLKTVRGDVGDSDTGLVHLIPFLGLLKQAPAVVIHRDPNDVADSMHRIGFPNTRMRMREQAQILRTLEMQWDGPVLHVEYEHIDRSGAAIWRHCIGGGFDAHRWERLCRLKVEVLLDRERERYERITGEKFPTYRA